MAWLAPFRQYLPRFGQETRDILSSSLDPWSLIMIHYNSYNSDVGYVPAC